MSQTAVARVASEELILGGFRLDTCSTGQTLIQTKPDPVAHVVFPDGDRLTMWVDLDRACGSAHWI